MEYNSLFGFKESPFSETQDLKYFYLTKQHASLLEALKHYGKAPQGVALLTGEAGVGKTMLAQALLTDLPPGVSSLFISQPAPEPLAISVRIAQALGLELWEKNLVSLNRLEEALRQRARQGQGLLVVVDQAHLLKDQQLEELYLLSQMEDQGRQLLGLLLLGRRALRQKLAGKIHQRLSGVISLNLELAPLSFEETKGYLEHRLHLAGSSYKDCFADGCAARIFATTGGIPLRINQICHQALQRALKENCPRVTRELLGEEKPSPSYQPLRPPSRHRTVLQAALAALALLALGLGLFFGYRHLTDYSQIFLSSQKAGSPGGDAAPRAGEQKPPQEPKPAETTLPSPAPGASGPEGLTSPPGGPTAAPSPETSFSGGIHQVSAGDGGLLKIVAARYQEQKDLGYEAVILANEDIKNEDVLHVGQILVLPLVDPEHQIISLTPTGHYLFLKNVPEAAEAAKIMTRLQKLEVKVTLRETSLRGSHKNFRIYLGPYESREELLQAKTKALQP